MLHDWSDGQLVVKQNCCSADEVKEEIAGCPAHRFSSSSLKYLGFLSSSSAQTANSRSASSFSDSLEL